MSTATVSGLWIYPVKSCRGISLKEMQIGPTGPKHDREWMIVDDKNKFISLRSNPKLSEIKTALQGPFLHLYAGTNKILINTEEYSSDLEMVTVWTDTFLASVASKDVNEALSDFISQSVKLVRYQKESFRALGAASTSAVKQTMFADSRPILLTNESSIAELSGHLNSQNLMPSVIERFRSNIILSDIPAYAEDYFKEIKIGEVGFKNPRLCTRCMVVTQDVETGKVVSKETLKVLSETHKPNVHQAEAHKVTFGINLTPSNLGTIHLNDSVTQIF